MRKVKVEYKNHLTGVKREVEYLNLEAAYYGLKVDAMTFARELNRKNPDKYVKVTFHDDGLFIDMDDAPVCCYVIVTSDTEMSAFSIEQVRHLAYNLYKQEWVHTNVSYPVKMETLRLYYRYVEDCIVAGVTGDSFEDWILNNGYQGMLFASYLEFMKTTYHDKLYMVNLLKNENWVNMYLHDIA